MPLGLGGFRSLIAPVRLAGFVFAVFTLALFVAPAVARADALVMFEQVGCPYCAQWNRDVGSVYAKTDEGKLLPLVRVDLHAKRSAALDHIGGLRYTPTFVVVHCGREFSRITGYLGDEQFWGLIDASLRSLKEAPKCL